MSKLLSSFDLGWSGGRETGRIDYALAAIDNLPAIRQHDHRRPPEIEFLYRIGLC